MYGLYRDDRKESRNYCLGFRVEGLGGFPANSGSLVGSP